MIILGRSSFDSAKCMGGTAWLVSQNLDMGIEQHDAK